MNTVSMNWSISDWREDTRAENLDRKCTVFTIGNTRGTYIVKSPIPHFTHINSSTKWSGWNDSGHKHMLTTCLTKFPHYSVFCETKRPPEMNLETQLGFKPRTSEYQSHHQGTLTPGQWTRRQDHKHMVYIPYSNPVHSLSFMLDPLWPGIGMIPTQDVTFVISAPRSIISRPLTNWANSNGDPNRHKRKSQLNEDKHLQCQHFHQNFKLFRSLRVPNEGVGELTGKMH